MSFKSILVAIPGNAADATASQAACKFALDYAKRDGGFVQGLLVASDRDVEEREPRPMTSTMMPQDTIGAGVPSHMPVGPAAAPEAGPRHDPSEQIYERARTAFRTQCESLGVEFTETTDGTKLPAASWRSDQGDSLNDVIVREAAGYDLVVLPAPSAVKDAEGAAKRALTETGKPVLVIPPSGKEDGNLKRERILIAWNGGVQAWHAVSAGLPFLQEAESVEVLTVDPPTGSGASRDKLLRYLACHGIEASTYEQPSRSLSVGEAILGEASEGEFNLLLMGAYSHGPLREKLVGGTTRHVLTHAAVTPVFLAH